MSAIEIRRATSADKRLLWQWRNDVLVRQMFRNSHEVSWDEHSKWYEKALANPQMVIMICERAGKSVGTVRFDLKQHGLAEISISVAPSARNQGVGGGALTCACRFGFDVLCLREIRAEIKEENVSSTRLFRKAGFVHCETKDNLHVYRLTRNGSSENASRASERKE